MCIANAQPEGATEDEVVEIAKGAGLSNVRLKDVKGRMSEYAGHKYVEPSNRGWRVTDFAKQKYGDVLSSIREAATGTDTTEFMSDVVRKEFERVGWLSSPTNHPTRNPEQEG